MVRALIVAVAALGTVLLASCGAPKEAPIRLQIFGDPAEITAYRELIAAFETANPGKKVELIPVGKQKDHMAKLATGFAAGDAPELFILNFRRFGQFAARGVLEPLGPALTQRGQFKREDFYEPSVEAFELGGSLQCLPQNVSSLVVYYNKALFERFKVPLPSANWRFHEFHNAAARLTQDTDSDGRTDIYGVGLDPLLIRVAPFIWGMGGDIVDDLHKPTRLTMGTVFAQRALGYLKRLVSQLGVAPPLAAHQAEDEESRFARGALGMLFNSRRYTATLRQIKGLDWDVAPMPLLIKPASALHADAYCMAKSAKDKETAMDFVAFALGEEGQAIITRSGRLVPSRKSVAQSPVFLDPKLPPASSQVFLDAIPHLRRTPNVAVWHEVETKADQILEEWYFEPPLAGQVEMEAEGAVELLLPLQDAVDPILRKAAKEDAK